MSNEAKAQEVLDQIIAENQANNFEGIDRSEAAIAQRRERMNVAGGKDKGESDFGRKLEAHVINGDISSEQSSRVLLCLYGLG